MATHYVLVQLDDEAEALVEELKAEGVSVHEAPRRALAMLSDLERYARDWDARAGDATQSTRR